MESLRNCSAQSELKKIDESRNAEKRRNTPNERRRGREGNQEHVTGNRAAPSTGIPSPKPEGTYDLGHAVAEVQGELVVADSDKKYRLPVLGLVPSSPFLWVGRPRGCPLVASGTATRPPQRARSQRGGVKAPPGADPWPPEPPQSCCTIGNDTLKPPCNTWWREVKQTVQRPPLCLRREYRLRHSPTVVAGSSLDCRCTGTKGKCLMYAAKGGNEEAQTSPSPLRSSMGARGLCIVPGDCVGELSEYVYP